MLVLQTERAPPAQIENVEKQSSGRETPQRGLPGGRSARTSSGLHIVYHTHTPPPRLREVYPARHTLLLLALLPVPPGRPTLRFTPATDCFSTFFDLQHAAGGAGGGGGGGGGGGSDCRTVRVRRAVDDEQAFVPCGSVMAVNSVWRRRSSSSARDLPVLGGKFFSSRGKALHRPPPAPYAPGRGAFSGRTMRIVSTNRTGTTPAQWRQARPATAGRSMRSRMPTRKSRVPCQPEHRAVLQAAGLVEPSSGNSVAEIALSSHRPRR